MATAAQVLKIGFSTLVQRSYVIARSLQQSNPSLFYGLLWMYIVFFETPDFLSGFLGTNHNLLGVLKIYILKKMN